MSNNSNDPRQVVSINDLANKQKISINYVDKKAHLFVGDTPRAQLSIELSNQPNNMSKDYYINRMKRLLLSIFPMAEISVQD